MTPVKNKTGTQKEIHKWLVSYLELIFKFAVLMTEQKI